MSPRARVAVSLLFAIAMGFFEAAIVVDLRRLWELGEFDVTRGLLSGRLHLTEGVREVASLAMIVAVAILSGRRGLDRLAHAAIIFGTWDILYYVYLSVLIGWPASLLDWDVLFLIPRPWIGPVLAPVLVSAALLAGGLVVALREAGERPIRPGRISWILALLGGAVVIGSFLGHEVPPSPAAPLSGFSWTLFLLGLGLALAGYAHALWRSRGAPGREPVVAGAKVRPDTLRPLR